MNEQSIKTNSVKAWILAARPKTLTGAATPVMIGLAAVYHDMGTLMLVPSLLCLLFAFIMQIDANFVNDYFDFKKGTDDDTRLGPKRACAEGWISLNVMKKGIIVTTALACVTGLPLIIYGGWWMIAVGILCIIFCILYTTKLSYIGLGDILVIVFFGLVPTGVTYYLQLHTCTAPVILLSAGCGFVIDTLLIVNNFRDRETDAIGGKKTLILLLNERAGYHLYFVCGLIGVMLAVTALVMLKTSIIITIIPCIYLLLLYLTYKRMGRIWKGRELNSILGETARNIFLFGILTSIALIL